MAVGNTHGFGSPDGDTFGASTTAKVSFHGVTPTAQRAGAAQATLTLTSATAAGFGFTTSAAFSAMTAQLEEIRAALVEKGILKGAA
jgi:hypothetical protein